MKMNMEIILILIICCNKFVQSQKTALDKYIPQFQAFRDAYFGLFIPPTKDLHNLRRAKNLNVRFPHIFKILHKLIVNSDVKYFVRKEFQNIINVFAEITTRNIR